MAATSFHFGASTRQLFGVYHASEKRVARAPAALLFNPFGEEAIRAFRLYKILAERLARNGVASLRFDYFGSGDSAGDDRDVTFMGMVDDARCAQEELAELSGARRFIWIGLGLGGAVAIKAAEEAIVLERLVLWDPVIDGAAYLNELRTAHTEFLSYARDEPLEVVRKKTPECQTEAIGFALSEKIRAELSGLNLYNENIPQAEKITLIHGCSTDPNPSFVDKLTAVGALDTFVDAEASWNSNDAMNAYYVPAAALDFILDRVTAQL